MLKIGIKFSLILSIFFLASMFVAEEAFAQMESMTIKGNTRPEIDSVFNLQVFIEGTSRASGGTFHAQGTIYEKDNPAWIVQEFTKFLYRGTNTVTIDMKASDRPYRVGVPYVVELQHTVNFAEFEFTPIEKKASSKYTTINSDTVCREDQALVYHLQKNEYICTSYSGAQMWSKTGQAQIIETPTLQESKVKSLIKQQPMAEKTSLKKLEAGQTLNKNEIRALLHAIEKGRIIETKEIADALETQMRNAGMLKSDASSQTLYFEKEKSLIPTADGGSGPLTVTPIIGNPTKTYPEFYVPGKEELSQDEMRLIFCGTGLPYVTYAQASSCLVVQTGDGRSFLFDLGSGSIGRINSLKIPGDELTHVFASHLHTDHIGDLGPFWSQAYLSGRTVPIELYGPTGQNHELGTTAFVEKFLEAWKWDFETRNGRVMNSGMAINAHEFDFSKTHVIFEEDGFRVTSFPAVHGIDGSVSFRIDWNDLSVIFSGDTNTNTFLVENSQEADVVILETFLPFEAFKEQFGFSEELYFGTVAEAHIPAERSGLFFSVVEPRLAVMYHQVVDERSIGQLYEAFRKGYSGPAIFAQDFTVINLTPEYIISRQADFDPSALPIPLDDKTATGTPNYFLSDWLEESVLYEDDLREMIAKKNEN